MRIFLIVSGIGIAIVLGWCAYILYLVKGVVM